jgi:hypothetical protein
VYYEFEKAMGIVGQASFVSTIHGFIDDLGYHHHLGQISEGVIESFDDDERYYHYGVNMVPNHLKETLEDVGCKLGLWAQHNHFDQNPFVHGSTAARAAKVSGSHLLRVSKECHDVGPGFYCFGGGLQSSLIQALSFAVDCSLPEENPTIFVFPQPKKRIEKSVGSWKLNDREFKTILGCNYEDFESRRSHWRKEDIAWKSFVSLCRACEDISDSGRDST